MIFLHCKPIKRKQVSGNFKNTITAQILTKFQSHAFLAYQNLSLQNLLTEIQDMHLTMTRISMFHIDQETLQTNFETLSNIIRK